MLTEKGSIRKSLSSLAATAAFENASNTTDERKSMSIKTSLLKRISQAAVVALVTGLMSFVAVPASNAQQDPAISGTCVARAGVGGILNITATGSVGRTTGSAVGVRIHAKEIARTAIDRRKRRGAPA